MKIRLFTGDRVVIYMPLIPEAVMAMLATVRIGAVHSVVFGGKLHDMSVCVCVFFFVDFENSSIPLSVYTYKSKAVKNLSSSTFIIYTFETWLNKNRECSLQTGTSSNTNTKKKRTKKQQQQNISCLFFNFHFE